MTTSLAISPRDGEFGKSWTRVIGRAVYYFELRRSPVGRRLMVMRCTTGTYRKQEIVHWLYDCDPAEYEAYVSGPM